MTIVGRREKGEEGSAWLARVGAPRTAESPCVPYMFFSLSPACAASRAALNGRPMRLVEIREERTGRSALLARLSAPRTATLPCDPYMFFSLSPACAASAALNGRPLHSGHALPSTLFSLLPTSPISAEPFVPVQESLDFFA